MNHTDSWEDIFLKQWIIILEYYRDIAGYVPVVFFLDILGILVYYYLFNALSGIEL